jgi:hypothetical protein
MKKSKLSSSMMKSNSIEVQAHGVIVRYGFISKQLHDQLKFESKLSLKVKTLKAHCNQVACKGVFLKHLRISIANDTVLRNLDDIKEHFPITFYPDTGLIEFGVRKKYVLVHFQYLNGKWVDDEITNLALKKLNFHYQYHDLSAKHHFPILNLRCKSKSLKEGKMKIAQEEFYLFDDDKTQTRLHHTKQ